MVSILLNSRNIFPAAHQNVVYGTSNITRKGIKDFGPSVKMIWKPPSSQWPFQKKEDSRIDRLNSWHFEISFSDQRLWTIIYDSIFTILMIICESSISCGSHCSRQINSTFLIPEFSPKIQVLKKMILDQFDNDFPKYYEWSLKIRQMVN